MDKPPQPVPPLPSENQNQQAAWVPTQATAGQPAVPASVPKKGMPWYLWALIGCGGFFLLFFVLIMITIVAINPVARLKEAQERVAKTATSSAKESIKATEFKEDKAYTAGWQVINGQFTHFEQNNLYKFSFKAPADFRVYVTYPELTAEMNKYFFSAKNSSTDLFSGQIEGPSLHTRLAGQVMEENPCPKPLELIIKYDSFEVCDNLKVAGMKALYLLETHYNSNSSEDPISCTDVGSNLYVAFNLDKYNGVIFTTKLDVLNDIAKPWEASLASRVSRGDTFKENPDDYCSTELESNQVKEKLSANIQNIRDAKGISSKDVTSINDLYQMLATFKIL